MPNAAKGSKMLRQIIKTQRKTRKKAIQNQPKAAKSCRMQENEKKIYKGILANIMEKNILLDQNKHMITIELDKISDAKLLV